MKTVRFTLLLVAALLVTLASAQTNAEKNKASYLAVVEGFNKRDFTAFEQHCTADMQDNFPPGFLEMTGLKGLAASKTFLQGMFTAFPDLKFEVKSVLADDKTILAYIIMSGTMKGEFLGMKPTGKSFKIDAADVLWINGDGKAFRHLGIQDNLDFFMQLGLTPGEPGK